MAELSRSFTGCLLSLALEHEINFSLGEGIRGVNDFENHYQKMIDKAFTLPYDRIDK